MAGAGNPFPFELWAQRPASSAGGRGLGELGRLSDSLLKEGPDRGSRTRQGNSGRSSSLERASVWNGQEIGRVTHGLTLPLRFKGC